MEEREKKLSDLGYAIEKAPKPGGLYTPVVIDGDTFYMSGAVPADSDGVKFTGKVPSAVSPEDATRAASLCAASLLRVFIRDVGPLSMIDRLIKVTGFVNSESDYTEPHFVVNGASQLFIDVLGDAGAHARSAIGTATLPLGVPVEVELIGKLRR